MNKLKEKPQKKKPLTAREKENAARLKDLWREYKGNRTQEDAAEYMDITQGAVSHFLNGITPINIEIVLKFSSFLKIPPERITTDFDYGYKDAVDGCIHVTQQELAVIEIMRKSTDSEKNDLRNGVEDQERIKEEITHRDKSDKKFYGG